MAGGCHVRLAQVGKYIDLATGEVLDDTDSEFVG